jgi:hypothetical protein
VLWVAVACAGSCYHTELIKQHADKDGKFASRPAMLQRRSKIAKIIAFAERTATLPCIGEYTYDSDGAYTNCRVCDVCFLAELEDSDIGRAIEENFSPKAIDSEVNIFDMTPGKFQLSDMAELVGLSGVVDEIFGEDEDDGYGGML